MCDNNDDDGHLDRVVELVAFFSDKQVRKFGISTPKLQIQVDEFGFYDGLDDDGSRERLHPLFQLLVLSPGKKDFGGFCSNSSSLVLSFIDD